MIINWLSLFFFKYIFEAVPAPTCMMDSPQFFRVKSGWFVGRGSGTVTSNPAAAICPVDRASYRSSWFTTPPLTQQTDQNFRQIQKKAPTLNTAS